MKAPKFEIGQRVIDKSPYALAGQPVEILEREYFAAPCSVRSPEGRGFANPGWFYFVGAFADGWPIYIHERHLRPVPPEVDEAVDQAIRQASKPPEEVCRVLWSNGSEA